MVPHKKQKHTSDIQSPEPASTSAKPLSGKLLTLPNELLNMILRRVLDMPHPVDLNPGWILPASDHLPQPCTAILQTNRLLRHLGLPLYYSLNIVHLQITERTCRTRSQAQSCWTPPQYAAEHVKHLILWTMHRDWTSAVWHLRPLVGVRHLVFGLADYSVMHSGSKGPKIYIMPQTEAPEEVKKVLREWGLLGEGRRLEYVDFMGHLIVGERAIIRLDNIQSWTIFHLVAGLRAQVPGMPVY